MPRSGKYNTSQGSARSDGISMCGRRFSLHHIIIACLLQGFSVHCGRTRNICETRFREQAKARAVKDRVSSNGPPLLLETTKKRHQQLRDATSDKSQHFFAANGGGRDYSVPP